MLKDANLPTTQVFFGMFNMSKAAIMSYHQINIAIIYPANNLRLLLTLLAGAQQGLMKV